MGFERFVNFRLLTNCERAVNNQGAEGSSLFVIPLF